MAFCYQISSHQPCSLHAISASVYLQAGDDNIGAEAESSQLLSRSLISPNAATGPRRLRPSASWRYCSPSQRQPPGHKAHAVWITIPSLKSQDTAQTAIQTIDLTVSVGGLSRVAVALEALIIRIDTQCVRVPSKQKSLDHLCHVPCELSGIPSTVSAAFGSTRLSLIASMEKDVAGGAVNRCVVQELLAHL